MTRDEVIDATRAFLRREILEDEAAPLAADEPLISAGIMTSFDLVSLSVFLEQRFEVKVPDAKVSRDYLDTLEQIATLVLSLRGEESGPVAGDAGRVDVAARWLVPSFRTRPLLVVVAMVVVAFVADRGLAELLDLEARERSDTARMSYSIPGYAAAMAKHDLSRPRAKDEVRIVFQGDSGTFGSYLDPREACPAVMGRELAALDSRARVYNTSLFGQTFVKDAAMLEAALPYAPDLVVISVASGYLSRVQQEEWWLKSPTTIVYNRPLFERFLDASPGARERPELMELAALLAATESRYGFQWKHRLEAISHLAEHQTFLEASLPAVLMPARFQVLSIARTALFDKNTCRYYRGKTLADVQHDAPFPLDPRVLVLLEAIVDRARAAGAEVVLFHEPEPHLPGPDGKPKLVPWDSEGFERIERALAGVVARKKLTYVDCRDLLPPEEFLDSERHWTVLGNELIGQRLARELAPLVARLGHGGR